MVGNVIYSTRNPSVDFKVNCSPIRYHEDLDNKLPEQSQFMEADRILGEYRFVLNPLAHMLLTPNYRCKPATHGSSLYVFTLPCALPLAIARNGLIG